MYMQRVAGASPVVEAASREAFDAVASAADPRHSFLRAAWFEADTGGPLDAIVIRSAGGRPLAAIPRVRRGRGPLGVAAVPGCYWPFRSFPVARDASAEDLAAGLASRQARAFLGPVWRMGPVFANDPTVLLLAAAAPLAGWTMLPRRLGHCFDIDLEALRADGPWPRTSSQAGVRRRERKLAEVGTLDYRFVTGCAWTGADRDAIAQIERDSPLAAMGETFHPKFADPARRRVWERAAEDPAVAVMMFCSLLHVGGAPAAFAFGIEAGGVRHCIANNYSRLFARHSPGKVLLYKDFEHAAARGAARIGWGAGDAGYKSEMDAAPGPEIIDLLFVRSRALAVPLKRYWKDRVGD